MVCTIKNQDGLVVGYIEWEVLDHNGQFANGGKYIYIQNLWIAYKYRNSPILYELAKKINEHPYSEKAGKVYWEIARDSEGKKLVDEEDKSFKSKRMSRCHDKEYILNKLRGEYDV